MDPIAVLFGSFIILLLIRVPIPFALMFSSVLTALVSKMPLMLIIQRMYSGVSSFALLAVPLFLLTGMLMDEGGITERLLKLSKSLVGNITGALAHVNIVVSMFFAGLTGSSVADTAAIGGVLIPAMIREGYSRRISAAVTAASSTIGIIIPPSIFMIVYGGVSGVSIGGLFLGGTIPGIMVGVGQMIIIYFYGKKYHYPKGESATIKEKATAFVDAIPVLMVPIIIIGGVTAGIFTATESGAVAIVYTLILILIVFRKKTSIKEFIEVFKNSILKIGPTLFCVTGATAYAYLMAYFKVPLLIQTFGIELGLGRIGALFFILIMCIFLGTFMSGVATIITFMPIITTLGAIGNVHPIQLGVIVCMTMALGLLTPPYGLCIMLAANIAEIEVMQAFKTTLIFIAFFLIVVSLCIFFPQIILFLPRLIMPTIV